ncbi:MAG: GGDEF domain-containing protein [Clostridiales Family XIII bacterium]|jgi:diguanylate cyclase (GGDEF)-like protein|nr:GGDEF domain-containing protein [Clostridiales Family XIII bacterium]
MEESRRQDATNEVLHCILACRFDEARAALDRVLDGETRELLEQLYRTHVDLNNYADEIAKGNFSVAPPPKGSSLFNSLKNLHAKLIHITWQIGQVAQGDYGQVVDYMGSLSDGFNEMTQQLRQRRQETEYLARHDSDTGLFNRNFFMRRVYDLIIERPDEAGALLCIGLDNLKHINDTFGREVGDQYIRRASKIFRRFESAGGLAARLSGDEFALYLHGFNNSNTAFDTVRDFVKEHLSKYLFTVLGVSHKFRASIGVALYPEDTRFVDELIKYSGYAMYETKRKNRGGIARFDSRVYSKSKDVFNRQVALDLLLDEKQIRFAFQPIIDMKDGSVFGYEALMRSKLPEFPSPLDILSVAEGQAKLFPLERLTFEALFAWMDEHFCDLGGKKMFFNIISDHFLSEIEMAHIHPNYRKIIPHLVFEILESSTEDGNLIKSISAFRKKFDAMIALDDYGIGYSNDYRLLNLETDIVKIDRFLVADIHLNTDKRTMMENVAAFCYTKDIKILVEGVETPEELQVCMQLGVDYVQGFYFAKPNFELIDPGTSFKDKMDAAL